MVFKAVFVAFALAVLPGWSSVRAQGSNPFENDIRAFEQSDLRNPPATNSILFIGSSTFTRWQKLAGAFPRYSVLNRGFGGSQMSDVLYFFGRVVKPYAPPLIVFYEGDNDLAAGKPVEQVYGDWTSLTGRVEREMPGTEIMFVTVKPSPSRASLLPKLRELNERIRQDAEADPRIHFADTFSPMLDASGQPRQELFTSDDLHMNEAGYALWEAILGAALDRWAADYRIIVARPETGALWIDAGSSDRPTGSPKASVTHWNNVTPAVGSSSSGVLANLKTTGGAVTPAALRMVSRFNGANENGTVSFPAYPASATRDSLFGNTETFSGLANIAPAFQIAGLNPESAYRLTFYASRLSAGDNRQTRYTVAGQSTNAAELNVANNVASVVAVTGMQPDAGGAVTISLTPGAQNNNANHFTYLGVLQIDELGGSGLGYLFDFGASGSPTGAIDPGLVGPVWNDLTEVVGTNANGRLTGLLEKNGAATGISLVMLAPFNAANLEGTENPALFPVSASSDSLFGNDAAFNGQANVRPSFKLTGLNRAGLYSFDFYGSRAGVTDNRETRYTASGENSGFADLDAANNVDGVARVRGIRPGSDGEIVISIGPGPNNTNPNRFTYCNALAVEWTVPPERTLKFLGLRKEGQGGSVTVRGTQGSLVRLEVSPDLKTWSEAATFRIASDSDTVELPPNGGSRFYRLVQL